ncbi:hypothetical protein Acr_10g0008240 [Actinidia rufa]|uniref:Retrovirus-related Pol polyprotein from transposon TNT 1-94-like beta-barrel domain-containing protein n=1 Tax=Actinidia rufa TaxID=165716 RepID=A0A7J0FB75_9ERIC|nr:hypothetical protein Acr_10g0008240 [Actinidia rufa]
MTEDKSDVLLTASVDEKLDWVLDSNSAYHLCRDREVFSTYATCEGLVWMTNNTANRVIGKGTVWFHMTNERSMTLIEWYLEDPEWYKSTGRYFEICAEVCPDMSGATSAGCPVRSSKEGDKEELYSDGEERWSHDNSQNDVLCGTPQWGVEKHLSEKVQALQCGEMKERKAKIDTYGGYTTTGSGGQCFRFAGPSYKIGTVRTVDRAISGNSSPLAWGLSEGDLALQVNLFPLMCLGIIANHCVLTKFQCSDHVGLAIERQPSNGYHAPIECGGPYCRGFSRVRRFDGDATCSAMANSKHMKKYSSEVKKTSEKANTLGSDLNKAKKKLVGEEAARKDSDAVAKSKLETDAT